MCPSSSIILDKLKYKVDVIGYLLSRPEWSSRRRSCSKKILQGIGSRCFQFILALLCCCAAVCPSSSIILDRLKYKVDVIGYLFSRPEWSSRRRSCSKKILQGIGSQCFQFSLRSMFLLSAFREDFGLRTQNNNVA